MNPFPGMNPYLETPQRWHNFQFGFMVVMSAKLNSLLPKEYLAAHDYHLLPIPPQYFGTSGTYSNTGKDMTFPPVTKYHGVVRIAEEPTKQLFVEIRKGSNRESIVVIIELLHPLCKILHSGTRSDHIARRQHYQNTGITYVEIDLSARGVHTSAISYDLLRKRGAWDQLITIYEPESPHEYEYWMSRYAEPLPEIMVSFSYAYEPVCINLQTIADEVYNAGAYHRIIDYTQPPPISLSEEQALWMDTLLREKGLRT